MEKSRLTKRIVSLGLVFLLSIQSFAAVVSDNDGSAFITKAEFDSLKSNFQSQIDQYNTSIDSKIDGAIASYLSGMSLTSQETLKTVLTKDEKIKNLKDATEVVYKKGLMTDEGIMTAWFRGFGPNTDSYRTTNALYEVQYNLKTSTKAEDYLFDKIYIENIDNTKKIGAFHSYNVDEKESLKLFQYYKDPSAWSAIDSFKDPGFVRIQHDMKWKTTGKTFDGSTGFVGNVWWEKTDGASANGIFTGGCDYGVGFFTRTYGIIKEKLILIPKSITYNRFTDYDRQAYNFSNDETINNACTSSGTWDSFKLSYLQQRGQNEYSNNVTVNQIETAKPGSWGKMYPPYEGFANTTLTNWNQIYNSAFDVAASYYTSGVTTDSNGVKHLMSYAGLPLCEIKRGNKLEYQLTWDGDTTKEYDVWVKMSPFGDKIPDDETGLETEIVGARGGTYIERGSNKYLTLKTGDRLILNAASADGYVFIKWREKGDASYGGGTLISTGEALMTKEA